MTNSLSEDIYTVGQLMADNLNTVGVSDADVDDGLTTLANKILNASPSEKVNTVLTLNTPLVVYTDQFNVTGVLTDNEDNPIEGATIQLIWNDGTEHIATGATNSNGVFSFTSTDPASVSSYSFQLFFAGDTDYNASNSSVVNVNTAKETSVMVITSPASGAVVSTDSVAVSGTLKDNDGTAMSEKSVSFSLNNVSAGTATVGSDGSFSKTVTGLIAGSNSISASFAATTTHTAASQSITVNRATFDGLADIELIDGSQILSYADEQSTPNSQYATLETQLMNGESAAAISGISVGFYDYTDENNPVLLGSDDTDSTGKASFTYHSSGVGDVPVKAKVGSFLTKTYSIRDAVYHHSGAFTSTTSLNIPNIPSNFKCLFKHSAPNGNTAWIEIGSDGNNCLMFGRTGSSYQLGVYTKVNNSYVANQSQNNVYSSNTPIETEYTYIDGVQTVKANGTTLSITNSSITSRQYSKITMNGTSDISDLTILPL